MSRTVGIHVTFEESRPILEVMDALLRSGWGFAEGGAVGYLPLGDQGMFDWQDAPLERWPEVRGVLEQKVVRGELLGIQLLWAGTEIGATFLLYPDSSITVSLKANRTRLEGCEPVTDFSWFLSRVLRPLVAAGNVIASVECHDLAS
jgi:hypothetical protein